MSICISCGTETEECLCASCAKTVDIEKLCDQIENYRPGFGENELWDQISAELSNPYRFRNVVFALADKLPTPRKEYRKILAICKITREAYGVPKDSRPWLYETYEAIKDSEGLTAEETSRLRGILLDALYKDYRFFDAEEIAKVLSEKENLPFPTIITLADFYSITRRYEKAEAIIDKAKKAYPESAKDYYLLKIEQKNAKYKENAETGKSEYLPRPDENKEQVQKAYLAFLASIGIKVQIPVSGGKNGSGLKPIPKDQYPEPVEERNANFNSFVAFDLETTGLNPTYDCMTEIGAVRVVDGKIEETKEFTFQEFVKLYKKGSIPEDVQQKTGITSEDVQDARPMWEVYPDFMKFVGDSLLVGYNCIAFDCKFLVRAGRYSHIIPKNKYFDVSRYANNFKEELGLPGGKVSLENLAEILQIENPQAHRALFDAITTAKVFLKLKELDKAAQPASFDEMLSGFEGM